VGLSNEAVEPSANWITGTTLEVNVGMSMD